MTTTSALPTASAADPAAVAPDGLAASADFAASRAANTTWWPAPANEVPSARPTLPVPMIAIFMVRFSLWPVLRAVLDVLVSAKQHCR